MAAEFATPITVVVIEPDLMYRDGLQAVLARDGRFALLRADATAEIDVIRDLQPNLIIVDPSQERQIDYALLRALRRAAPSSILAVLSMVTRRNAPIVSIQAGASAYCWRVPESDPRPLLDALVFAVQERGRWALIDARLVERLSVPEVEPPSAAEPAEPPPELTEMELRVLALLVQDMTEKQIAKTLFLARPTVDYHLRELRTKLKARSVRRLCYLAGKYGLV